MKQGIHPEYVECTVKCSCGNTFTTRSTKSELKVDICNVCHPFCTGQQRFVDTGGRVQRFADKFGSAKEQVAAREAAKKAERAAKAAEIEAAKKAEREAKAAAKAKRAEEFAKKAAAEAEKAAEIEAATAAAEAVEAPAEAEVEAAAETRCRIAPQHQAQKALHKKQQEGPRKRRFPAFWGHCAYAAWAYRTKCVSGQSSSRQVDSLFPTR